MTEVVYQGQRIKVHKSVKSASRSTPVGGRIAVKKDKNRAIIFRKRKESGFGMWQIEKVVLI